MSETANVIRMLADEGITGPAADAACYEMLRHHSPPVIESVTRLLAGGYTPESIGAGLRLADRQAGRKPNENHISNCMAVARHLIRTRREEGMRA